MHSKAESILEDIHHLVQDELRVVSYKWLARQYQIPSNTAKQLLHQYVERKGTTVTAIYVVSGYIKDDPTHHVTRLVDSSQLQACCMDLADQPGIHVHSVLPAEPHPVTDPGRLCAEDTLQARNLYQMLLKHDTDSSTDAFARNACSCVKFEVTVAAAPCKQQQQQQQQVSAADNSTRPAVAAVAGRNAAEAPTFKRQRHSAVQQVSRGTGKEDVWEDDEAHKPAQQCDQCDDITARPAAPPPHEAGQQGHESREAVTAVGAAGKSTAAGPSRLGGKAPTGSRGGKGVRGSKATGQKNITSFFKK